MMPREHHHQQGLLDTSRSRFHGRGEEMVKGAAMETVLLLRQCPPSVAENYAVAVRDMNAVSA